MTLFLFLSLKGHTEASTTMLIARFGYWCMLVGVMSRAAAGAEGPATQVVEAAEMRMLRSQVTQLQEQVVGLKMENERLRGKLTSAGISVEDGQGVNAANSTRPKRVVVAVDFAWPGESANAEAIRVISQLEPDQWFNVVTSGVVNMQVAALPMFGSMQHATPQYREKASSHFKGLRMSAYERTTLLGALKFRPEVIIYLGGYPNAETIADVVKENRGINARVYTTTMYAQSPQALHGLWQLAHDTGGRCVDADGQPVDEPGLPIAVPAPVRPGPATKPSVFKVN